MHIPNVKIIDTGKNNSIDLSDIKCDGINEIEVTGDNNTITCKSGCILKNIKFKIYANNSEITLENNVRFAGHILIKRFNNNKVIIGEGTTVGGARLICSESTQIIIGKDCMLSSGIEIRSTDSHPILSIQGDRINQAADILIGDHVWLAAHSTILKGTRIGSHSVVGTQAVVSGNFSQGNEAIAGNPARIVRSGITWDRELLG